MSSPPQQARLLGYAAETAARDYLIEQGLQCVERNFKSYFGEIDLIMVDQQTLVFVEVKMRSHHDIRAIVEQVSNSKQKKIMKTAFFYLQKRGLLNTMPCRFDVVAIERRNADLQMHWIKHAF